MRYLIEVLPSGEIYSCGSFPEEISPMPINGGTIHEVPERCSPTECAYYDGIVVDTPPRPDEFHKYNYSERRWVDNRSFEELRELKWVEIKLARDAAEFGGFSWGGYKFDTDETSRNRIMGAVQLASIALANGIPYSNEWTLKDNSVLLFSAAEMIDLGLNLGHYVNRVHSYGRILRLRKDEAATVEALNAIHWDTVEFEVFK